MEKITRRNLAPILGGIAASLVGFRVTGIETREPKLINLAEADQVTALQFECLAGFEEQLLDESARYFPMIIRMPCGNELHLNHRSDIPRESKLCPCGNPKHMLVWWIYKEEIKA